MDKPKSGLCLPSASILDDTPLKRKVNVKSYREIRRWLINPEESRRLRRWDLCMVLALGFVCFVTPFEVGFLTEQKDLNFLLAGADALFWINRFFDCCFIADMILQFFIMYPVSNRYGNVYVSSRTLIIRQYLKTWFGLDLISILPFDFIGIIVSSDDVMKLRLLRSVRLLRLLKLFRLLRGFRILRRWEVEFSFSYRRLTLWGLLGTVCLSAHLMSCTLGMISNIQGPVTDPACYAVDEPHDEDLPEGCVETWFTPFARDIVKHSGGLTAFQMYVVCLHVTVTIIVHPYAAKATSDGEQVCFTILLFVGGFIWTRVISRTTAVQTSLDRHGIYYRQTMDDLNHNSQHLALTVDLQKRLRSFFMNTRDSSQRSTWQDLTERMSPSLRTEVAVELHKVWLRRVPFLVGASRYLIADLAERILTEMFAQRETFGSNFRMYVMHRGVCSRNVGMRERIKLMLPGSVWGLEHLVFETATLLDPNTATAITFSEVLVLSREAFNVVRIDYPETSENIRKYHVQMAVVKGIIRYAHTVIQDASGTHREAPRRTMTLMTSDPEADEEEGEGQHRSHALRMQREMRRKMRAPGLGGITARTSRGTTHDGDACGSSMEERINRRIDMNISKLRSDLEDFMDEMRSEIQKLTAGLPAAEGNDVNAPQAAQSSMPEAPGSVRHSWSRL